MRSVFWQAAARVVAGLALTIGIVAGPGQLEPREASAQEHAARSWLGVAMREDKAAGRVFVRSVVTGSPAERAGLKAGDRIIWISGRDVAAPKDVVRAVAGLAPGAAVQLIVERAGKRETVTARVESMPSTEELLKREMVGKAAPAWTGLTSPGGRPSPTVESFRGRVVVLDFWASWCTACGFTTRHLNEWSTKYGPRGLTVVGVAPEPPDLVEAGAQRHGIRYQAVADPTMNTTEAYHVSELPTVVVVDKKGIVRDVATGYSRARLADLEAVVVRLLAEAP